MPYPNFHAARVNDPNKYDKFRNNKLTDGIQVIYGIKNKKSEIQSYRFDKTKYTAAEAKKWLKEHKFKYISFEKAEDKNESISPELFKVITLSKLKERL